MNVDKFQTFPVDLKILREEALKNLATKKQDAFDLGDKYRSNLKTLNILWKTNRQGVLTNMEDRKRKKLADIPKMNKKLMNVVSN